MYNWWWSCGLTQVTDEEGRRRFHGAFTGGYSTGYYNTVGSKEGWASFTSSRKNRAGAKKQSISDFLDEDEKAELEGHSLSACNKFCDSVPTSVLLGSDDFV